MHVLDGRVAVITGGASGIGRATVELFVASGARVIIADIQDEAGRLLADSLGTAAVYRRTDVTREEDVRAAVETEVSRFGRLDCMFNNAGVPGPSGPIDAIAVEDFDRTVAILLRGVFLGVKHAAAVMKQCGSGSIINTASVAGLRAGYAGHVYSAAKAAVEHLTKSVATELGECVNQEPESTFKRRRDGGALSWPALPATREEVVAIADSFQAAVPKGTLFSLRGREATEVNLRQRIGQFEYVHLATHGFFALPTKSTVAKKNDIRQGFITDGPPKPVGPNPGLLSGIVCSGANNPNAEGVLTALDIAELDLTKVELVVLSACDTGLGETAGGEGVFGLQRALGLAGARTTITSLWKVKDQATRDLMMRYYENFFKKNLGSLESLREAQLWMLQEGRVRGFDANETELKEAKKDKPPVKRTPPVYWAAFSLAGDWR
jgi:NADP-dependent 3-hydroxy acid dehydrogenase YdfG